MTRSIAWSLWQLSFLFLYCHITCSHGRLRAVFEGKASWSPPSFVFMHLWSNSLDNPSEIAPRENVKTGTNPYFWPYRTGVVISGGGGIPRGITAHCIYQCRNTVRMWCLLIIDEVSRTCNCVQPTIGDPKYTLHYTVSPKLHHFCFCNNSVECQPISIIYSTMTGK